MLIDMHFLPHHRFTGGLFGYTLKAVEMLHYKASRGGDLKFEGFNLKRAAAAEEEKKAGDNKEGGAPGSPPGAKRRRIEHGGEFAVAAPAA